MKIDTARALSSDDKRAFENRKLMTTSDQTMFEHYAYLAAPANLIFDAISRRAQQNSFSVEQEAARLTVTAPLGLLTMHATEDGIEVSLKADTPEKLQLFSDLYAQRFSELGFETSLTWRHVSAKVPLNQTLTRVVSSDLTTPNFRRVRLSGDFTPFQREDSGLHFRFLFGLQGQRWPYLDGRGITVWPSGVQNWHRPPYTVRRIGKNADWIDVDIYVHAGGRTTDWSSLVKPGDEIAIHGPSGSTQPKAHWLGLCGDETALPVILRIIEDAPEQTRGIAKIFLRDPQDIQDVDNNSGIQLTWGNLGELDHLEASLAAVNPTDDNYYVLFAGERQVAGAVRNVFKSKGLDTKKMKVASYWTKWVHNH